MMILTQEKYYFRFGIRKLTQFLNPGVYTWVSFNFPKEAIFHYNTYDASSLGPDMKDVIYSNISKKIPLCFVTELNQTSPGVMKKAIPFLTLAKDWIANNKKKFLIMNDFKPFINQPLLPMIYNYETLGSTYKYPSMPMSKYNEWKDRTETLWQSIDGSIHREGRNHYVVMELPDEIPAISSFVYWAKNPPIPEITNVFKDHKMLNLLEFWKFFNPNNPKCKSIIKSNVAVRNYKNINIILKYNSKWALINLAYLYRWTKKENNEEDIEVPGILQNLPKEKMQRAFLALVIKIQEAAAEDAKSEETSSIDLVNTKGLVDDESSLSDDVIEAGINKLNKKDEEDSDDVEDVNAIQTRVDDNDDVVDEDKLKDAKMDDDFFEEADKEQDSAAGNFNDKIDKVLESKGEVNEAKMNTATSGLVPSRKRKLTLNVTDKDLHDYVFKDGTSKEVLEDILESYKDESIITNLEYKKLLKEVEHMDNISLAYTEGKLKDFIVYKPEDLQLDPKACQLPGSINIEDTSMTKSSLQSFDTTYVKKVLRKDLAAVVNSIQKAGIILQDYQVEEVPSILGDYEIHTLKVRPLDGQPSTIKFRFPKVDENNNFTINGISYRLRKQQADVPIVKISKNRVALSSYYGKAFVYRSEAKADDTLGWINDLIVVDGMSDNSKHIAKVKLADLFDNLIKVHRHYSSLASRFAEIEFKNGVSLDFNYKERITKFGKENIAKYEKNGRIVCGLTHLNEIVTIGEDGDFIAHRGSNTRNIGDICSLAGIDLKKAPVEFAVTDVAGKRVPIGVVLGYFLGFTNLLKLLKTKYKVFDKNKNPPIANNEWVLTFKDKKYIFNRNDKKSSLILGGFRHYKNSIKLYASELYDKPNVYLNMIESRGLSSRHIKELNNLNSLFVDPITKTVLEDMNEPVTYLGLLVRATELLETDYYPDDLDMRYKRIRGIERMVGAVYQELSKTIREFKHKNTRGNSKLEMSPFAVWTNVSEDQSKMPVANINPIEHLKSDEAVTMVGQGGRCKESLVKETRAYHPSHVGTMSDATVSSGDVGSNNFLCANPQFRSLRGRTNEYDIKSGEGAANFLYTASLAAVGMEHEDGKRTNFIANQSSHVVPCVGYRQPMLRTGYEAMMPHRCKEPFAVTAKKAGKVISVDEYGIIVEDEDGRRGYSLGTQYGACEGTYYNHEMVTPLKVGDKFLPGDPIVYNTGFFEPDVLNPRQIIWKTSFLVKTALYESSQTLEDGSAISKKTCEKLLTSVIKIRDFVIEFKQGLKNVVKVGDKVEPGTVIMIIEDEITNEYNIFDKETLSSLQRLANKAPKAKYKGVIDRIEVFYNGEVKDMSASLQELTKYSDKIIQRRCKSSGKTIHNGQVDKEYRVEGNPLLENTANVKFYIKVILDAGNGDKGVYGNQLKSTFSEVMNYEMRTESGEEIGAVFGYKSIHARIVLSPEIQGTTNVLLQKIADKACKIYFGEK